MKKITSFLMMAVFCCINAFAQDIVGEELPVGKLVAMGTCQNQMVPGQWYFVHSPRNPNQSASNFTVVDEYCTGDGGLVHENDDLKVLLTSSEKMNAMNDEAGVPYETCKNCFVRFVKVEGEDGAYYIEFASGNFMADNPINSTVTKFQMLDGQAGKYNFYLIKNGGTEEPNIAGRFGWNKYNMQNIVDNNGAGGTVVFWGDGEITKEESDGGIIGNNVWEIFNIEIIGDADAYETAYQTLYTKVKAYDPNTIQDLKDGKNVGTSWGNYLPADVAAFLKAYDLAYQALQVGAKNMEDLKDTYPTPESLTKLGTDLDAAKKKMDDNKLPLAMDNIAPGYYFINSALDFNATKDTLILCTAEQADSINKANADVEGFVKKEEGDTLEVKQITYHPVKSIYDDNGTAKWNTQELKLSFIWKVETVDGAPAEYRITNLYANRNFGVSAPGTLEVNDSTHCFDFAGTKDGGITKMGIRGSWQPVNGWKYIHADGHSSGNGKNGTIVSWELTDPSKWYLEPVDESIVEQLLASDEVKLAKMIEKGDSIAKVFPAQLKIAQDSINVVANNASQFYSPYSVNDSQNIPEGKTIYDFLIDDNKNTYWHSDWSNKPDGNLVHYLQIESAKPLNGEFKVRMVRRQHNGNQITRLAVRGYDENNEELTYEDGEDLGIIDMPLNTDALTEPFFSSNFTSNGSKVIRFYCAETKKLADSAEEELGFWHAAEFNIYLDQAYTRYAKTQYAVRKQEADAVIAALDVWEGKQFAKDSLELLKDETFTNAYNTLVDAWTVWTQVYVDPAPLREALAAAPDAKIFVEGTQPGYWPAGTETPAKTIESAQTYDESGAYTKEQSAEYIKNIEEKTANAFASANKVQTSKWYKISFATEEQYDTFGWDKDPVDGTTDDQDIYGSTYLINQPMFGKVVSIGKQANEYGEITVEEENEEGETVEVADTVVIYKVAATEDYFDGNNLVLLDPADEVAEGANLFRFIQATDSSFIIQNKATGLFLRGGRPTSLSAIPTYFEVNAIGAGANLISYTDVLGKTPTHKNLHAEQSTNRLTCWEANTLGSNSMMYLTEAGEVGKEPATTYIKKQWPGEIYTYTMPVDVKILSDNATAYAAEVNLGTEEQKDTTIVLKKINDEVIKAGYPFLLIADLDGDYISYTDRKKEVEQEVIESEGMLSHPQNDEVNKTLDQEYVRIEMNHGMEVDTIVKNYASLVGTMSDVTVKPGKGIYADENGFGLVTKNTTIYAYAAYVDFTFNATSEDVLSKLEVVVEGGIDTGIKEVLNKVSQSGNIYNAAGQLVGKGNINTVNNLPAGIYVVNGVKVIKH